MVFIHSVCQIDAATAKKKAAFRAFGVQPFWLTQNSFD